MWPAELSAANSDKIARPTPRIMSSWISDRNRSEYGSGRNVSSLARELNGCCGRYRWSTCSCTSAMETSSLTPAGPSQIVPGLERVSCRSLTPLRSTNPEHPCMRLRPRCNPARALHISDGSEGPWRCWTSPCQRKTGSRASGHKFYHRVRICSLALGSNEYLTPACDDGTSLIGFSTLRRISVSARVG
jgi:hypothetical protein